MRRAHQPGSKPIHIPERIPNPAHPDNAPTQPKEPAPIEPAKEPVKVPEKVPA